MRRSNADLNRRITQLEAMVVRLGRELHRRPVIVKSGTSSSYMVANIIGGNTLDSGQGGINYDTVTSVPSAYDPMIDTTFIDGIGRAQLFVNNVAQADYVLVVNSGSTYGSPFSIPLAAGLTVRVINSTAIPVGAGPTTVTAYVVAYL